MYYLTQIRNFSLLMITVCITFSVKSQSLSEFVPDAFRQHPEYGLLKYGDDALSVELIQHRTENSRTFVDGKGTYHTTRTGGYFHYKNDKNEWVSIQDVLSRKGNEVGIFQTPMPLSVNFADKSINMTLEKQGRSISFGANTSLYIIGENRNILKQERLSSSSSLPEYDDHKITLKDFFPRIDRVHTLEYWSLQTDYVINNRLDIPETAHTVEIRDEFILPSSWQITYNDGEESESGWKGSLRITDENGNTVSTISSPLLYDSFATNVKEEMQGHVGMGSYRIERAENKWIITLVVDAQWLRNEELVYPVTIDPTVTNTYVNNHGVQDQYTTFNANCQATMDLTVPLGSYQVTRTDITWRMWAKGLIYSSGFTENYADKTEQRSRVGAHLTGTSWSAVQNGSGTNHSGSFYTYTAANNGQTYTLNNQNIANGCYNTSTITYIWQGYQTFFPHGASGPASANVAGCATNYQELVLNTWTVTTTYDPVTMTMTATPMVDTICSGERTNVTLTSVTPNTTYAWTVAAGTVTGAAAGNGAAITQTLTSASNGPETVVYTITPTYGICRGTPVNVNITVQPSPVVDAGNDLTICEGEQVTLTATGADTYSWDNGVQNGVTFIPATTTTYQVTGTSDAGCSSTDNVTVTVVPLPGADFSSDINSGCLPVTVVFTNNSPQTGNVSCEWRFGDGGVSSDCATSTHTYTQQGCYDVSLTVTTPEGCVSHNRVEDLICSSPIPVASFNISPSDLDLLSPNTSFVNTSEGATTYSWDFGDGSPSSSVKNPEHSYPGDHAGNYTVILIVSNDMGCKDTARTTIYIKDEMLYYVPNAFTPDGDELNPVFKPIFTAGFDPFDYKLTIYNRWGEIIFESNDASVGWDGTFSKQRGIVADGTYLWRINFTVLRTNERKSISGVVNLIR